MKSWFQPKSDSGKTSFVKGSPPRINLAAFGKHPGWEDFMPGIGLETAGLAQIKQTLYVSGIGGQITAGAWEPAKLEPEKRVAGFDHWFLWRRAATLYCGRFWSSSDRVGRKEYPMVLCLESTGVSPGTLLSKAWPELERLRQACVKIDTADRVVEECRASQEHFQQTAAGLSASDSAVGVQPQVRRDFLQRQELGPDRLGLLRVLHELERTTNANDRGPGSSPAAFDASRSYHVRVPRACDTDGGGLWLWLEFLSCSLPFAPVLLLARADAGWVDIVFGEPESSDLYCLQASPKALPLATEIPYELDPGLAGRLKELEARFLSQAQTAPAAKPAVLPRSEHPPLKEQPEWRSSTRTGSKPGGMRWVMVIAGILIVLGILVVLMAGGGGNRTSEGTNPDRTGQPVEENKTTRFDTLVNEGGQLSEQGRYAEAKARFDEALQIKPGDEKVVNLRDEAQARAQAAQAVQESQARYEAAIEAAQTAKTAGNWEEVIRQAEAALAVKPADAAATKLKAEAQNSLAVAVQAEHDYRSATNAAALALAKGNYEEAIRQSDVALKLKPSDAAAAQLKETAEQEQAAAVQKEEAYGAATNAAAIALNSKDYEEAIRQADMALGTKPNDPLALKLKTQAQQAQAAAAKAVSEYDAAMSAVSRALEAKDYTEAIRQADVALTLRPGDPAATKAKTDAQDLQKKAVVLAQYEEAMSQARAAFEQKDYVRAVHFADGALTNRPGDAEATRLKSDAQRLMKEMEATQAYTSAMAQGRTALDQAKYQNAIDRAEQALKIKPADPAASELRDKASAALALQQAKDLIARGEYDQAQSIYEAHSSDPAFAELPKTIETEKAKRSEQRLVQLDTDLQKYLVMFNVLSADDPYVTRPEARRQSRLGGRLSGQGVDYYLGEVKRIEAGLRTGGWLKQNERESYLKDLRSAILLAQ